MRYEELTGPLKGWTFDENGTIYTVSGYACSARTIECALWLLQCYGRDVRQHPIHSDEKAGALCHSTNPATPTPNYLPPSCAERSSDGKPADARCAFATS